MVGFPPIKVTPAYASCNDLLLEDEQLLTKRDIGKRFLATQDSINPETKKCGMFTKLLIMAWVMW